MKSHKSEPPAEAREARVLESHHGKHAVLARCALQGGLHGRGQLARHMMEDERALLQSRGRRRALRSRPAVEEVVLWFM